MTANRVSTWALSTKKSPREKKEAKTGTGLANPMPNQAFSCRMVKKIEEKSLRPTCHGTTA
jgi:hypothetical protein